MPSDPNDEPGLAWGRMADTLIDDVPHTETIYRRENKALLKLSLKFII